MRKKKKKTDRAQYEQTWKASLAAEEKSKKKDSAKRKDEADVAQDQSNKVVPEQSVATKTTQEVDASIPTLIDEALVNKVGEDMTKPKQPETSHEATSKDTANVIVDTTTSRPTPINYAPQKVEEKENKRETQF